MACHTAFIVLTTGHALSRQLIYAMRRKNANVHPKPTRPVENVTISHSGNKANVLLLPTAVVDETALYLPLRCEMPAGSATPLLLLLDSVLCQDREQLDTAMNQVRKLLRSDMPPVPNLSDVVGMLIKNRPDLACVASEHDNSLPLHFAASIGDVSVADILIAAVSLCSDRFVCLLLSRQCI